ncbi:MAG: response regulator [Methylacidiphilales bacterium]|nr:response regulator [Candidatus Methylacidiphilales bacterium]
MLHQALILTSHREYAQTMRQGLLKLAHAEARVDVELDALRAMQLGPQQYDLILLDTVLDAMDGLQLLQLIKHQAPASKFIIVSDSADETSRAVAYQNGADFFLERPHAPKDFALALEAIKGLFKSNVMEGPLLKTGDIPIASIADIVQMRCLSGDSVLLLVRSQSQSGDIFIFRGEIFHAQYPGKSGESAFRDMIRWDGGRVRIQAVKLTNIPPRTIEIPYRQLLETADKSAPPEPDINSTGGELYVVPGEAAPDTAALSVVREAPPRENAPPTASPTPGVPPTGGTALPNLNSHWKVNLSGDLLEGSQVSEPDRCAFITSFIYRKMADVAVALEVDYFNHMTLLGPHLQQVLVADNLGVRHGVFDTAWTTEDMRNQYVKWCCEQSL